MKFRTLYGEKKKRKSPTGEKTEMRHRAVIHKNGRRELVRDKEVAIYDLIQANREECEIEHIIRRATEGDYNALNAINGQYADITNMPSSIAEAQQMVINMKNEFEKLPKEVKAKFEYNPEIYVAEFGSESWAEKTGYKAAIEAQKKAAESRIKLDENTAKAMENLAAGLTITNSGEVINNE